MSELSNQRKRELIVYIEGVLKRSNLLQSASDPNRKIAKTAWGIIEQFMRLLDHKFQNDEERKRQFFQWVDELPKLSKSEKVNEADLKKLQSFLTRPDFKALSLLEIRYVVGWIRRLSEGNE